ncbi:MAG: cyclic nucleotide-binding domain-containing protein [Acidimicrobiales bacterium]|jgi:CRP-like cAMP-binding protein
MTTESLFFNAPDHRTIGAGEVIYAEGDAGAHMFGIVSGSVALYKGSIVVAALGPEDVFGERALIDHLPRNLTAVATSETTLAEIDRHLFLFLVHESPTFALGVMNALASRLREYDELFGDGSRMAAALDSRDITASRSGH